MGRFAGTTGNVESGGRRGGSGRGRGGEWEWDWDWEWEYDETGPATTAASPTSAATACESDEQFRVLDHVPCALRPDRVDFFPPSSPSPRSFFPIPIPTTHLDHFPRPPFAPLPTPPFLSGFPLLLRAQFTPALRAPSLRCSFIISSAIIRFSLPLFFFVPVVVFFRNVGFGRRFDDGGPFDEVAGSEGAGWSRRWRWGGDRGSEEVLGECGEWWEWGRVG